MNEQVWVALALWIFMVLIGYRFREFFVLSFASLMGFILSILILMEGWTLIGLGLLALNLYLMYVSLTNW